MPPCCHQDLASTVHALHTTPWSFLKKQAGGKHWTEKMGQKLIFQIAWVFGLGGGHHPV